MRAALREQPLLRDLRERQLVLGRRMSDWRHGTRFASSVAREPLAIELVRHASVLRRRLRGVDPRLQETKVVNLRLAADRLDGLMVRPGEVVSLWQRIGPPTASRGFVEGLTLWSGEVRTGVGGGLCQLSNLVYWMALHTPLSIVEHHHHGFDAFPDDRRTVPFGCGASVYYPAGDLRLGNPTDRLFQLRVWLTDEDLNGSIRIDREWPVRYHVEERDHRFERLADGTIRRRNELWRRTIDRRTHEPIARELVATNDAVVRYPVPARLLAPGRVLASAPMEAHRLDEVRSELASSGRRFREVVRSHDLSVGLYVVPADGTDDQSPHTEDEVYYVVAGAARITVGDEDQAVGPGSIVFVPADTPHHFHDIETELVVLVVFGPAEYTHRVDHERGHPHVAPRE